MGDHIDEVVSVMQRYQKGKYSGEQLFITQKLPDEKNMHFLFYDELKVRKKKNTVRKKCVQICSRQLILVSWLQLNISF